MTLRATNDFLKAGVVADFVDALGRLHRRVNTLALTSAFLLSAAVIVLTTLPVAASWLVQAVVIPLFIAALIWPVEGARGDEFARLRRSFTLQAASVYLVTLVFATGLRTDALPDAVWHDFVFVLKHSIELVFFLAIAGYLTIVNRCFLRLLILTMAALLTIAGVIDIVAFLSVPKSGPFLNYRLEGAVGMLGFRNATHVAPLFAIYGLAALALAMRSKFVSERIGLLAASSIMFATILLTQARGGIAIAFVGFVAVAALSRHRARWLLLGVIVVASVGLLANNATRQALLERGDSFRGSLMDAYLDLARQRPLLGFGVGQNLLVRINDNVFEQPHNTYVWAQVRGGLIAGLATIAMVTTALFAAFRYWRNAGHPSPLVMVGAMALTGLTEIGFLVTDFSWVWVVFWLPLGIGVGVELAIKEADPARAYAAPLQ